MALTALRAVVVVASATSVIVLTESEPEPELAFFEPPVVAVEVSVACSSSALVVFDDFLAEVVVAVESAAVSVLMLVSVSVSSPDAVAVAVAVAASVVSSTAEDVFFEPLALVVVVALVEVAATEELVESSPSSPALLF